MSSVQSIVSISASSWSLKIFTSHSLSAVSGWKGSHVLIRPSTTRKTCLMLRKITVMSACKSSESSERSGSDGWPDSLLDSDSRLELSERVSLTVTATALRTRRTSFCIRDRSLADWRPGWIGARSRSRSARTCRMTRCARLQGSSGKKSCNASVEP